MNKVWKILVVSLLAVVLLGLTTTALADTKNAFSFTSGKQVIDGEGSDTFSFTLATKAASLTITAEVAAIDSEEDTDDCDVAIKPNIPKTADHPETERRHFEATGKQTWTLTNVKADTYTVKVNAYDETDTVTWKVTVKGSYEIKVTPSKKLYLHKGQTKTLTSNYTKGTTAEMKAITWTSANKKIATATKGTSSAKIKGIAGGKTTVTLKAFGQSKSVNIIVYAMSQEKPTVYTGKSVKLSILNLPTDTPVTWSSNKTELATVSSKGQVTGKKATAKGEYVTITAKFNDPAGGAHTLTAKVTVTKNPYPKTMQVTGGALALRKAPNGTLIKFVKDGTKVTVTGLHATNKAWAKVTVGGQSGYMMLKFLKDVSSSSTSTDTEKPTPNVSMKVINGKLALRKSAGGSLIGYVKDGASVLAADAGDGWCYVKVAKKYMVDAALQGDGYYYGYMMKSYLQKK